MRKWIYEIGEIRKISIEGDFREFRGKITDKKIDGYAVYYKVEPLDDIDLSLHMENGELWVNDFEIGELAEE